MTNAPTRIIVDLDAHIREVFKQNYSGYDVRNIQVGYNGVRFDTQINYLLDQLIPSEEMDTIDQLEQRNNTSLIQPMEIRRSEEVISSYTWSSEHGFSVGVSVSASIKVPFVGGIDTSVETSYSFTKTESQTEERKRGWDFTQTVNVAPFTKVIALLMIQKTRPQIPYTLACTITGTLFTSGQLYKDGVHQANAEASWYVSSVLAKKPLSQFSYSGITTYFNTSGAFRANEGIKAIIDLNEIPLQGGVRKAKHSIIDVTPGMQPEMKVTEK